MDIGQLLSPETILIQAPPEKKSELLKTMVQAICQKNPSIRLERAFQSVMEREKVTSTFMDSGLALPHARLPQLSDCVASLAILPQGFESTKGPSKSNQPNLILRTYFVFLFLSPEGNLAAHLQVLSKASWLFQNEAMKEKLLHVKDSAEALKILQEAESQTTHGSQKSST